MKLSHGVKGGRREQGVGDKGAEDKNKSEILISKS
jgi:hypothetical protein